MDAFLTPDEMAIRRRIRDYFRNERGVIEDGSSGSSSLPDPGLLLKDMGFSELSSVGAGGREGLLEKALIIEEVSSASPRLGRALIPARNVPEVQSGTEDLVASIAWSIGTAAAILDVCLRAAREKGLFDSTLMDHQKAQLTLGELLSGLEAARLQTYRALRLIDHGDKLRGEEELGRASGLADKIQGEARALASALLGESWVAERIPENERSRS
jgi:hypothetical protein